MNEFSFHLLSDFSDIYFFITGFVLFCSVYVVVSIHTCMFVVCVDVLRWQ